MIDRTEINERLKNAAMRQFVSASEINSLLSDGADAKCVDLFFLVNRQPSLSANVLESLDSLLTHGASPDYRDGQLLEFAIGGVRSLKNKGDDALLDVLFKHCVNVNINNGFCLMSVISMGRIDALKNLVSHKGKLTACQHDQIANACSRLSSEEMLTYCLDRLKKELGAPAFKKTCNENVERWLVCATANDRPDLLDLLIKRFNVSPPADLFKIAAERFSVKTMDYLLDRGNQGDCNGLLSAMLARAFVDHYREGDDQQIARVVDKLLSIETSDTLQAVDSRVPLDVMDSLMVAGRTHTLKVLVDRGVIDHLALDEANENQKIAKDVCEIAERKGFSVDCDSFPSLEFCTRDNASSVSDCEYGEIDIERAKALIGAIKNKYPKLDLLMDTCDEWVNVSVEKTKAHESLDDELTDCRLV